MGVDQRTVRSSPTHPLEEITRDRTSPQMGILEQVGIGLNVTPASPSLRLPNGHPTQNPEAEKKAEVSLRYFASGPSF